MAAGLSAHATDNTPSELQVESSQTTWIDYLKELILSFFDYLRVHLDPSL